MASKLEIYSQMADQTARRITGSFADWLAFLDTAARLYKYPFHEQLMIYAQKPDATACADYDLWNKQMRRYVRRGTQGIALIDNSGDAPKLKYVFDVSDTAGKENSRRPYLWQYREEHRSAVTAALEQRYGISCENDLGEQLERIAEKLVAEYWNDNGEDVLDILADSFLEEYDDYNVGVAFKNAATVSTTYALMSRCGLNPGEYFEHEDFLSVFDFNTRDTITALGTLISNTSEQVLRHIETTIKSYEREASLHRQAERTENHESDLHTQRRLPDPQHSADRERSEAPHQVRQDAEEVSGGASPDPVEHHDSVGEAVPPSEGDRRGSEPETGSSDERADEEVRRDGGAESDRPDEVDGTDEYAESTGGGNDPRGADLRLTGEEDEYGQFALFPSEAEQLKIIEEAESVEPTPFASSVSQEEIDHFLRLGSNTDHCREILVAEVQKDKSTADLAARMQELFHGGYGIKTGNGEFTAWYAEDGIHIAKGRTARYTKTAQIISWEDAAERVRQLVNEGNLATNVELAEAEGFERMQLAQSLWYLARDRTEEARERGFLSVLSGIHGTGFPSETEWLAEQLRDDDFREQLRTEYDAFITAYTNGEDVLRFRYHKLMRMAHAIRDLDLPRLEFSTDMTELPEVGHFITEDEIDDALSRGGIYSDSTACTYAFFTEQHTTKEKTDYLKSQYGLGGHSHALSGSTGSSMDHDGKGMKLQKRDCFPVEMSWSKVAARFDDLIRLGRYFSPEELEKYELNRFTPEEALISASENPVLEDESVLEVVEESAENGSESTAEVEETPAATLAPVRTELTQENIDKALQRWNGSVESKRSVARYMAEHGREKDTAAWLANEYGGEVGQPLHIALAGTDIDEVVPWSKVQRRIAKLIAEERFFTEDEYDRLENIDPVVIRETLAERGIVNGEVVDEEAHNNSPFIQMVEADVKRIADEEFAKSYLIPGESTFEIDGRMFLVDRVNLDFGTVNFQDITFANDTGFPIFRTESIDYVRRYMEKAEKEATIYIPVDGEWKGFHSQEEAEKAAHEEQKAEIRRNAQNFRITDDDLGVGGAKAKFQANVNAIRLLKSLEAENAQAIPEQQEVLSRYVGWGGLADAFDPDKENWKKEYEELKELLTPEEYTAAKSTVLNAHFTSPTVIKGIYEAVERMGFKTGNILEPAMGVGNFFGCLPESMKDSRLYGVELDSITGRIAKQLYPKADITVAGFETTDRRDFFDLAIGNVPFGQYQVYDRAYNKLGFSIHDYFFAKTLDQVRPGGVIAFVTSRYTMDKQSPEVRKHIAQRAEFLGAIRLPNNAFKANAGTEVVSDIIFLQKRESPIEVEPDWVHLAENDDGYAINSYFVEHPEMILGRQSEDSTQYGRMDFTVEPIEGLELADQLHNAVKNIRGTYTEVEMPDLGDGEKIKDTIPADPNVKNYSYTVVDGEVYYRENSLMVKPDLSATAKERVKGLVRLRDCTQKLIAQQMDGYQSDDAIRETQAELNRLYDAFTAKHGLINSRGNELAFADDSSYFLLCSLEILDEDKNLKRKADMFTKRTIRPREVVTSVDTASEALALSISERACVDMAYMSSLTGKTEQELADDLRGVIYMDFNRKPDGSYTWRTADDFLSGNVREKLKFYTDALETVQGTDKYEAVLANVEALKSAQPKDLDASEIEVRLGATWIDKEYIQQFMYETFEPPYYMRRNINVNFSPFSAEWNITGKTQISYNDVNAYMTYGTERANAYKILEDTLNLRDVRVYDTRIEDGKERRVLNSKETTLAQQKQQAIKDAFQNWIWSDPDRRHTLVQKYNELFNSTRPREYDGSHITFSGMNPEIQLREHQLNAVAHVLYGGNTLLAHEVGSGKTFEMVAAAMESKRLGLCQKPIFVVPNHLIEQWAAEFLRLYPSANILASTKKDFEPKNRKKFCARIATGDYDAVIIGHSQFERIPMSQARQERLLQEQIDEVEDGITSLKSQRAERFTIKSLERTKRGLEAKLKKLQDTVRKDDVVTFEQLGVDRLYVDEAHSHKNLFLYTKMRNVAGLSTTDAQKSSDMYLKCRYIDEITGSKGIVFATGTPVSNSMTELYTMMRYLQHDTLRDKGLSHFDCWASTFGETTTAIELAPEGTGYRARTRFSKFFNLPELMTLFKEVADIKTADQLSLPTPTPIYHNEVAQPTEIQRAMVQELSERAGKVHAGLVDASVDNMLKVTSDGRKLGLDQRIINPNLPDDPMSKVNMCVNNVFRIWEDGKEDKLTQLIFCDLSTPKAAPSKKNATDKIDSPELHALEQIVDKIADDPASNFNVYDDIREKLVKMGIPREQIAFIHEANTESRKKELFAKVRTGQVRVLMGSTFKMGAGSNVQDRLIALHDLDAPWRPGDLEQRSGRIIRQGNMNPEVHIYRYVTEATFDAYLWQTLETKQKFISQIMSSKSPVRACEDADETALSYAEIKALCAGDERIKEKMDLDVDVARLKLMKASHQSQQYRLEDNLLRYFPEQIEQNKKFVAGFEADMKTLSEHPHPVDGFAGMTVRGDVLTDKENAGAALVDAFKEVKGLEPVEIGSYRGFKLFLTLEDFGREYVLTIRGQMPHRVTLGKDPRGNLTRIENALNAMPERLAAAQARVDSLHDQMENAKAELGKPFPQEEELRVKSARLAELNIELNIDDKTPMEQLVEDATEDKIAKSSRPSILEQLKTIQPVRGNPHQKYKEEVR